MILNADAAGNITKPPENAIRHLVEIHDTRRISSVLHKNPIHI